MKRNANTDKVKIFASGFVAVFQDIRHLINALFKKDDEMGVYRGISFRADTSVPVIRRCFFFF